MNVVPVTWASDNAGREYQPECATVVVAARAHGGPPGRNTKPRSDEDHESN